MDFPRRKPANTRKEQVLKKRIFSYYHLTNVVPQKTRRVKKNESAPPAYRQIKNSDFQVEKTEAPVSGEFFHGKVDRVDGTDKYVRVIDYKTGAIDDSPTSYYTGQKIQLELQ